MNHSPLRNRLFLAVTLLFLSSSCVDTDNTKKPCSATNPCKDAGRDLARDLPVAPADTPLPSFDVPSGPIDVALPPADTRVILDGASEENPDALRQDANPLEGGAAVDSTADQAIDRPEDSGQDVPVVFEAGTDGTMTLDATDTLPFEDANLGVACSVGGLPKPAGTLCRPAAGPCDQVETCDGVLLTCPTDQFLPSSTLCRGAEDLCDIPEKCTGLNATCPADKVTLAAVECRPAAGDCDLTEFCDGQSKACPADVVQSIAFVCRPEAGDCDREETCNGQEPDCPEDEFYGSGSICRLGNGACDEDDRCSGTSPTCPFTFVTEGTACRDSTSNCDPEEVCSGTSGTCPGNAQYTAPATAPTGVTAISPGSITSATVSWQAVAGATGYVIRRSTGTSTNYLAIANTPFLTYTDSGLTGGTTYNYVVTAIAGVATCESPTSSVVSVTPSGTCVPAAPAIPTGLTATAGHRRVTLNWAASTNALSYVLARSNNATTGYITLNTGTLTGTTYTDLSLTNGAAYYYRILAKGQNCDSEWSNAVSATPACTPPAPAPAITSAVPDPNGQVAVTWSPSANAITYQLSRSETSTGGFASVATVTATSTATSYTTTDIPLVNPATQKTFYYQVSALIDTACATSSTPPPISANACKAPTAPTVTATASAAQVELAWNTSTGTTSYDILRSASATGTFASIATATQTTTRYTNTGLENGATYFYQVKANLGTSCASTSGIASGTPCIAPTATATTTATNNSITLQWNDTKAPTYTVRHGTSTAALTGTATATSTSYTLTGLTAGTPYYAVVSSSNSSCPSGDSTVVSATPTGCNSLPGTPTLSAVEGNGQVTLTYTTVTGGTGALTYQFAYATAAGGPYTNIPSGTTTPFVHTGLTNGTTYYYIVRATDSVGCASSNSAEKSATPTGTICAGVFCDDFQTYATGGAASKWIVGAGTWSVQNDATAPVGSKVYQNISTINSNSQAGSTAYGNTTVEATMKVISYSSNSGSNAVGVYARDNGSNQFILSIGGDGVAYLRRSFTSSTEIDTCSTSGGRVAMPHSPAPVVTVAQSSPRSTGWFKLKLVVSGTVAAGGILLQGYVNTGSGYPANPNVTCTILDGSYQMATGLAGVQSKGNAPALYDDVVVSSP